MPATVHLPSWAALVILILSMCSSGGNLCRTDFLGRRRQAAKMSDGGGGGGGAGPAGPAKRGGDWAQMVPKTPFCSSPARSQQECSWTSCRTRHLAGLWLWRAGRPRKCGALRRGSSGRLRLRVCPACAWGRPMEAAAGVPERLPGAPRPRRRPTFSPCAQALRLVREQKVAYSGLSSSRTVAPAGPASRLDKKRRRRRWRQCRHCRMPPLLHAAKCRSLPTRPLLHCRCHPGAANKLEEQQLVLGAPQVPRSSWQVQLAELTKWLDGKHLLLRRVGRCAMHAVWCAHVRACREVRAATHQVFRRCCMHSLPTAQRALRRLCPHFQRAAPPWQACVQLWHPELRTAAASNPARPAGPAAAGAAGRAAAGFGGAALCHAGPAGPAQRPHQAGAGRRSGRAAVGIPGRAGRAAPAAAPALQCTVPARRHGRLHRGTPDPGEPERGGGPPGSSCLQGLAAQPSGRMQPLCQARRAGATR